MSRDSKFLALILRHSPEVVGIELDRGGWVKIDRLLQALKQYGRRMSYAEIEAIVRDNDKKRFTISKDGTRIRAAQGHSVEVDLGLLPATPPAILFHGTARNSLNQIFLEGLKPGRRRQVHLSSDVETATAVGGRHGKPVVLQVAAKKMSEQGHVFHVADNGVWLTNEVPVAYLSFAIVQDGTSNCESSEL